MAETERNGECMWTVMCKAGQAAWHGIYDDKRCGFNAKILGPECIIHIHIQMVAEMMMEERKEIATERWI